MRRSLAALALSTLASLAAPILGRAESAAQSISGTELAAKLASGTAPVLLDVRSEAEYRAGHIAGALHVPHDAVATRADEIPAARNAPVVVTCERGPRAVAAKAALEAAGFEQVLLLEGHMAGWRAAELPLEVPWHGGTRGKELP
ncbi:MAG TPA: rhodanese-like domain-containing protein [Myxococcota bacterium]|nr:rhodanese-like domain-containing protein [Myxococcota bacterium]